MASANNVSLRIRGGISSAEPTSVHKGGQSVNQSRRMAIRAEITGLLVMLTVACVPSGLAQTPDPDTVTTLGSTVPSNGDVNPYGVARVPRTIGRLVQGNFLVSNFNN